MGINKKEPLSVDKGSFTRTLYENEILFLYYDVNVLVAYLKQKLLLCNKAFLL